MRDHVIRINDLHIMTQRDIARGDHSRPLLAQGEAGLVLAMHADCQTFQVQQDVDHVFLHALDGCVFVQYALDRGLHYGAAGNRRQQNSTQRVSQGMAKAALQRLKHHLGVSRPGGLHIDKAGP
jgi:hypothetical protein